MELRHLRCFVAVAEELHFVRAAERLHIEQSPLSRAIKELEYDLGVQLFESATRSTRLTWAGQVFLEDVHRVFATIDQAKANVKSAATGYHGTLRIALSDGIAPSRLAALLAQCRAGSLPRNRADRWPAPVPRVSSVRQPRPCRGMSGSPAPRQLQAVAPRL